MASNDEKNFINYTDFDKEKLFLKEGKVNKTYGYRTFEIKYTYPDGEDRVLRLRSPALFSYGIKKYEKEGGDYFMTLKSFYYEKNPKEKEIGFKETLNSISEFLREELSEYSEIKEDDLKEMEILVDQKVFFPKLRQNKIYGDDKKLKKRNEITADFNEKEKNREIEKKDPLMVYQKNCEVIVYIDIPDIFVKKNHVPKIHTFISGAIVTKTGVYPPLNFEKPTGIKLEPGDED